MSRPGLLLAAAILGLRAGLGAPGPAPAAGRPLIVSPRHASFAEALAAREVRRYVYLRTGRLLPIVEAEAALPNGAGIVVARKDRAIVRDVPNVARLAPQAYLLKTVETAGRRAVVIAGGDDAGTLYGAYRFAERLGVRFYLHGDVVPDRPIPFRLPVLDERGEPLFGLRGLNPWGSHAEGFDLWNRDDYKALISQMAKLRMNFIGIHCYPEGHPHAEPTVWVGRRGDFDDQGRVAFSYPASYFNTLRSRWGYRPKKTSQYSFGGARLFERDVWGPDVMLGHCPEPQEPQACNEVFNRTAGLLRDAFRHARALGIKTCVGTEVPLVVPKLVRARLRGRGIQEVYEGTFLRILKAYPIDYYWLWTREGWTWRGSTAAQWNAAAADIRAALAAAKRVEAPFQLAVCGWVLGPTGDRASFDRLLPKAMPLSALSRKVGHAPIEPAFADIRGRPTWAIPWLEDDPALTSPQLWVGRIRKDAADALSYGCTGLIGLHWRTRILGPNVAALAQAAWDTKRRREDRRRRPTPQRPEGPLGGKLAAYPNRPIAHTDDDPLYQTCRYDTRGYRLKVPNGTYRVTLKFCEPHFNAANRRVCDVKLEGKPVIQRLDIYARVGKFAALDFTFGDIKVADGWLDIDIAYRVSLPCLSAIAVEGEGFSRKINCGGPAYKDYVADWPASSSAQARYLPAARFYADWALHQFGPEAAEDIARIFQRIDCRLPRPSTWVGGAGGLRPDARPWAQVAKAYAFVDDLAKLRPKITGAGSLDRFDYWLHSFRYLRGQARVKCLWGQLNQAIKAREAAAALRARKELIQAVGELYGELLATVSTPGAMATVINWEQHIWPALIDKTGRDLAKLLGRPLPPDAMPSKGYRGPLRVIVPTARTSLTAGEALKLKVIILADKPPLTAALLWRPLGADAFASVALTHIARGVYTVRLPADGGAGADFEYYVEAVADDGKAARFPATAPAMNHTVVVVPK